MLSPVQAAMVVQASIEPPPVEQQISGAVHVAIPQLTMVGGGGIASGGIASGDIASGGIASIVLTGTSGIEPPLSAGGALSAVGVGPSDGGSLPDPPPHGASAKSTIHE